MTRYTNISYIT